MISTQLSRDGTAQGGRLTVLYKQTTESIYLGGTVSTAKHISTETTCHISAPWTRVKKNSFQQHDLPNAQLSLKIGLLRLVVVTGML